MLTRLRVQGFKNLRNVDLHFGPFTCIAGANGAGKSNLFDAIALLGSLATKPVVDTLLSVRGSNGRMSEIASLFSHADSGTVATMLFTADMILPKTVRDDFDRDANPTATFVEYSVKLCYDPNRPVAEGDRIYIEHETLRAKSSSDALKWLPFEPETAWLKEHVLGPGPRTKPFIDTQPSADGAGPAITLYGEGGRRGRPPSVPARKSPQTVLCGVNAITYPTALAARNEMRSWRLLQLEPSALRQHDELHGSPRISAIGEHLPSALLRVGDFAEVTRRLGELIPGVVSVNVDTDPVRQARTLTVTLRDRLSYPASALSDGTLRFLALAILASDPQSPSLTCIEEPENGIQPKRIGAMLSLVRSLSSDSGESDKRVLAGQGLRQVLINTHSPLVVAELPQDTLLFAETLRRQGREFVNFKPMKGTWRAEAGSLPATEVVTQGEVEDALQGTRVQGSASRSKSRRPLVGDVLTLDLFS